MMKFAMTLAALIAAAPAAQAAQPAPDTPLELWRLDCGSIEIGDLGVYSDTGFFPASAK